VNVVDDEQIDVAIAIAELIHLAGLDGGDELVDEAVAGQIQDARVGRALENGWQTAWSKCVLPRPTPP
jgi:hypothetical protein